MNRSLPTVDALNGLLIKNYPDGHLSIAKNGTQVMSGEQLFLLSGEAIVHNLGIGDAVLGVGHPFKVDGISPLLKNITTQAEVENLIEQAIANGVDPFPLLESLEATAAGESVPLGGGGSFFVLDPLYGAGQVNAGYDTRGIDFTVESTERDVPLFERRETTTTTQSAITEPEPPTPEPPAPEPISLTTTNLTFDETFGLQTGSASLLSNLSSSEVDSLTFSAPNATWDSASQTLTANDGSWSLKYNADTQNYEFTQLQAFQHADSTNPDDSMAIPVSVTLTRTDGAVATSTFNITMYDDGPRIETTSQVLNLTVDESNFTANDSANFSESFTVNAGVDGISSIKYALSVTAGSTGLVDALTNEAIVLSINEKGVVEGKTARGGELVFTLSVDSTGTVTLDQLRAVLHSPNTGSDQSATLNSPDLIQLTAAITDNDGDTALASLNIGQALNFKDDGPSINASAAADSLTVDETTLGNDASANFADNFTSSFGEDGAGQIDYSLSVHEGVTGLVDTATNEAVVLSINNDGVVEGRTATSNDLVFTVSVNGNGTVTLDQLRAVVHSPNTGADQPISLNAADLIQLTATITDKDGDSASAHLDLG
ncbi:DUF5801 repeats-in-toxin domain-containing protein, partial [Legionella hackeliae]|uniref:DUF5801 repeats-in-toxin domain-containing protein n=1 Tax=Legionella hackeliae TaxID=449 RepID=UPI00073C1875